MVSSCARSLDDLFDPFSFVLGIGGGDARSAGGVTERRDLLDLLDLDELRDDVWYGASLGVGRAWAAGPLDSSSVSQIAMLAGWLSQNNAPFVERPAW